MTKRKLAIGLALVLWGLAPSAAMAQRGAGAWELLGEQRVGFGNDRDVITLNHGEEFYRNRAYRRLRFAAEGGELRMKEIRLIYLNGHSEVVDVSRTLRPGEQFDVDLRGERSYLRQIEMNYSAKVGFSFGGGGIGINQASVKVFGENLRAGGFAPPPPPPAPLPPHVPPVAGGGGAGWFEVAGGSFDRQEQAVELRLGYAARAGQLRLRNDGESITVRALHVEFRNGERQDIPLDLRLEPGQESRRIDLSGDRPRSIVRLSVSLEPRRRPGQATLTVLGTERPGREQGQPPGGYGGGPDRTAWIPLGEQTVGFRVDRDVIRVNQSEEWHRSRRFERLHFLVEGNDIQFIGVQLTYMNGYSENFPIQQLVPAGSEIPIDLGGSRSFIREIVMTYHSRPGFGGRAVVKVYGEPSRRR